MFLLEYAATARESDRSWKSKNINWRRISWRTPRNPMIRPGWNMTVWNRNWRNLTCQNGCTCAFRESGAGNLRKQQLEGQINVLNEQILAGAQNEEHYKGRLQTIEAELAVT